MKNKSLNKAGDLRGMAPQSQRNLDGHRNKNGRPRNSLCVTTRQREKLTEICPFDGQGRTWLEALAESGMRMALAKPEAWANLMDRLEGKITLPVAGSGEVVLRVVYDNDSRDGIPNSST